MRADLHVHEIDILPVQPDVLPSDPLELEATVKALPFRTLLGIIIPPTYSLS